MDLKEYIKRETILKDKLEKDLDKLRTKYIESNAEFKVGDFIYNVTGIIKVEKVDLWIWDRDGHTKDIEVEYWGYKYRKSNGVLYKTKNYNKELSKLGDNVKKVEYDRVD